MESSQHHKVIAFLATVVVILGCSNLFLIVTSLNLLQKLSTEVEKNQQQTPVKTAAQIYECKFNPQNEKIREKGYIKKEKDDRDLGSEFMYIFYFDEPFLLWVNGSGSPQYAKSIELYDSDHASFAINNFLNKHVELAGELTWGYAESRVIQPQAIRVI